jgi:hypothetical protein
MGLMVRPIGFCAGVPVDPAGAAGAGADAAVLFGAVIMVRDTAALWAGAAGGVVVPDAAGGAGRRPAMGLNVVSVLANGVLPDQPGKTARTSSTGWKDGISPRSDVINEA